MEKEALGTTKPSRESVSKKTQVKEIAEAIVIALILAMVIRPFVLQACKIPSGSMEDPLLIGDHIIVSKFAYGLQVPKLAEVNLLGVNVPFLETKLIRTWGDIHRGDVVVFRFPGDRSKDYIKRVIGLPGDRVELRDKVIYVNNEKWNDPYGVYKGRVYGDDPEKTVNFGPYTVPDGFVFCMGDNRDRSYDSRYWGPVPIYDIKGKAEIIYWAWDKEDHWVRFRRIGRLIH